MKNDKSMTCLPIQKETYDAAYAIAKSLDEIESQASVVVDAMVNNTQVLIQSVSASIALYEELCEEDGFQDDSFLDVHMQYMVDDFGSFVRQDFEKDFSRRMKYFKRLISQLYPDSKESIKERWSAKDLHLAKCCFGELWPYCFAINAVLGEEASVEAASNEALTVFDLLCKTNLEKQWLEREQQILDCQVNIEETTRIIALITLLIAIFTFIATVISTVKTCG